MKKLTYLFLLMFLLWTVDCGLSTITYADIPHLINYQGKLTDSSNKALEGSYNVTFRIYDASAGGNLLWQETQTISAQKGIFSVLLGGVTALNVSFDKPYYLGIQVGSDTEMTPRQRITSAGYAFKAKDADTVSNVGVSTTPSANKLLPLDANAKLPAGIVSSNCQFFTTNGTWTAPAGVTKVYLTMCGGGGGGCGGGGAGSTGNVKSGTTGGAGGNSSFNSTAIAFGGAGSTGQGGVSTAIGGLAGGNGQGGASSGYSQFGCYAGDGGAGGASGAMFIKKPYAVTSGNSYAVVVGAGGTGAFGRAAGSNGQNLSIGGGAGGAGAGGYAGTGGSGGSGGSGAGGSATIYGGGGGGGGGGNYSGGTAYPGGPGGNGAAGFVLVEW